LRNISSGIQSAPIQTIAFCRNSFPRWIAAWDGNGGYCHALINPTKDGNFVGQIIAHIDMKWHEFSSLEEAALMLAAEADIYYDQIS
jgi:hypothetical protein